MYWWTYVHLVCIQSQASELIDVKCHKLQINAVRDPQLFNLINCIENVQHMYLWPKRVENYFWDCNIQILTHFVIEPNKNTYSLHNTCMHNTAIVYRSRYIIMIYL